MAEADCSDGFGAEEVNAYERLCSTTSGVTLTSTVTDEEYDLLPLPEVDEDFLDDRVCQDDCSREVPRCVSFSSIHNEPVPFASTRRRCYLPGQKIYVVVADVEIVDRGRLLSSNMYVIHLTHGDYKWTIRKRYKHFRQLHEVLLLYRARMKIPMPTRDHREKRRKFGLHPQTLPHFPKRPETLVRPELMEKRKHQLELYLQDMLRCPQFRNHPETLKFLEVSHLSFVKNLGGKWKEGYVLKRSGGRRVGLGLIRGLRGLVKWMAIWTRRWLMVKDTFVAYVRPSDGVIADVVLMDRDFNVKIGQQDTGVTNGLRISNLTRHLSLKCGTPNQTREWQRSITDAASTTGSEFTTPNRFKSFAPEREGSYASWFQDAASYMSVAADAMEAAREEIFITGWWLSPEVYMKRPHTDGNYWRLDKILERKAEEGVKVFVLLFKEMEFAVGLNSFYSKQALTKLHTNIKVLRHPDGFSLWSHHEKCIVIDQRVAFLGGVDICYGRWDTPSHRLTDLGSVTHDHHASSDRTIHVGIHDIDHSSPEKVECDQSNISQDVWNQMLQPRSMVSTCISQVLVMPMMSVPQAAVSETHLVALSKMTATSDSELIKKCSSYPRALDGIAVTNGSVSDANGNTNQSCRGMDISPQTAEVVVSAVQIVIENTEESLDVTTEDPPGLSGLDAVTEHYCSVTNSRSVTENSDLCVTATNGHDHVDTPGTKAQQCPVCTSDQDIKVVNNNNENTTSASSKIPYIDTDSDKEFQEVSMDKRHGDTGKHRRESPSRTSPVCRVVNRTMCSTNAGNSQPGSSEREASITPSVAETLLELYAKVKSRQTNPTESGGDLKADLLSSVAVQNGSLPSTHVMQYSKEEEPSVMSYASSNGKTELNHNTYQQQNTSDNAGVDSKHPNDWSTPGKFHCISLDLADGFSGQDFTCPAARLTTNDLGHSEDLRQCSSLEKCVMNTKPVSDDTRLEQSGSTQKHRMELNSSTSKERPQLNSSRADQKLQPRSTEQRLQTNTASAEQTLQPDKSSTEPTLQPNSVSAEPTLEPNHSSTKQILKPNNHNTGQTTVLSDSTPDLNRSISEPVSAQLDLLTIDPPDLSFSMLKDALEPPGAVRLRPHSGSWSRDRRRSLSTLSCFISDGEPLLLHNYLKEVGDFSDTDGGEEVVGLAVEEPLTETPAATTESAILVKNTGNRKGFWRLKARGISLDIKAAVSQAQMVEEAQQMEHGIPYLSPTLATAKPSTPLPDRRPTFFQKARMIQHIRGKFIRPPRPDEYSCDVRELIENKSLFMEQPSPGTTLQDMGLEGDTKMWIGKDYTNFIQKDFVDLDQPFTDIIDRRTTPRMPWHDIGAVVYGKAARDVARHFIQRWNFTKLQKRKTSCDYPMLLPKSYRRVTLLEQVTRDAHCCDCQILRSASPWSVGISHVEDSIQQAYLELIRNAKHIIYIENQFFISTCDDHTENGIAEALYKRIIKAHSNGEVFRVYVVMPLLPAFEGELGTSSGAAIQVVMHWNYRSISRGGKSLLERLRAKIPDPFEYISFYGLRTHSELVGSLTTELIYVHSKLMIVDDTKVIIGSANINDRSLIGKRDSELAIVVEDTKMVPSCMNGKSCMVGRYASSLRQSLFREHLGLVSTKTSIDVSDPVIPDFYKGVWMKQAAINTSMYDKVFNCIPSDKVHDFHELRQQQKIEPLSQTCPTEARRLLTKVKGHLVLLPLRFLCREHLLPAIGFGTKEALAPTVIWK